MKIDYPIGATLYDGRQVEIWFRITDRGDFFKVHRMWVEPALDGVVFTTQDFWEAIKPDDDVIREELEES